MKQNRVISTAVLFLLLGTTIPAFAQKGEEEKGGGGGKAQPAQHQAQPQRAQKAQPQQRAQRAQPQQRAQKAQPQQRAQKAQPQQRRPAKHNRKRTQQAQPQQRAAVRQAQPQRASTTVQQGSRHSPLLATAAVANMAAFLTPITLPISVTATRSTWGAPR